MFRFALLFLALLAAPASAKCALTIPHEAKQQISFPIDETLFNTVFLDYINAYRCQANLPKLHSSRILSREAEKHADWMAKTVTVSHISTKKNRKTPKDRINQTQIKYLTGAENVARIAHYRIDEVPSFQEKSTCVFIHNGQLLEKRTYAQAAAFMSQGYMKSPGHRKNILNPTFTTTGIGVYLSPSDAYCGQIYHAQLFID